MLVLITVLLAAVSVAYANSFLGTFVFDDIPNIVDLCGIRSFEAAIDSDGNIIPIGLYRRDLTPIDFCLQLLHQPRQPLQLPPGQLADPCDNIGHPLLPVQRDDFGSCPFAEKCRNANCLRHHTSVITSSGSNRERDVYRAAA